MVDKHVALPGSFSGGRGFDEWIQKFEICATANDWDGAKQAKKIPTLLEGEALMTYLELSDDDKKDYSKIKRALSDEFVPDATRFQAMKEFERRKQIPGETPHAYLFNLKRLLGRALPDLDGVAKEALLLHHFIDGLPKHIGQQIRAIPEIKTAQDALVRARLLYVSDVDSDPVTQTASSAPVIDGDSTRLDHIEEMLTQLDKKLSNLDLDSDERVAAVNPPHVRGPRPRYNAGHQPVVQCYKCLQFGHVTRDCRNRVRCHNCGKQGHIKSQCQQGNEERLTVQANGVNRQS